MESESVIGTSKNKPIGIQLQVFYLTEWMTQKKKVLSKIQPEQPMLTKKPINI